ncbi:ubiquinone biosynthesis protein COQ7 [Gorgonomyces haynaldii]|nr:ubiquinone biosynthesis protein COQ7 [Gorgonomyces haynaldii]
MLRRYSTILNRLDKRKLDQMLRVDQAGEIGANTIYKGQLLVIKDPEFQRMTKHMLEQEQKHLRGLDEILASTRTRPSVLRPVWEAAGYTLGIVTGLMGKEACMACTEAVETVIGEHYNDQLRELQLHEGEDIEHLKKVIKEYRDDELEHLQTAVEHDASNAPMYSLLGAVIRTGCKVAIQVASRV